MKISHAVSRVRARLRPRPAHLPMRRGGRSPLRSSLRPRLRPSHRSTLQLATGADRRKRRWQRRFPARRFADISTLHLGRDGQTPLPHGVTPHKLRHTFASILIATGEDPASVMAQLGHTDPKFTLRVYTHIMRRGPAERARLKALVNGDQIEPGELPRAAQEVQQ